MPSSHLLSNQTLSQISQYIIEVVNHLATQSINSVNELTLIKCEVPSSQLNQPAVDAPEAESSFKLLLIGNSQLTKALSNLIIPLFNHPSATVTKALHIETLSTERFRAAPFGQRFDLGCFIHPLLGMNDADNSTSSSYNTHEVNNDELRFMATRLRDLFAHQSILFLPENKQHLSFNELGYSLAKLHESPDNNQSTLFRCWQFNLYDYKPRPKWLNSKYWANPENFDKYRW